MDMDMDGKFHIHGKPGLMPPLNIIWPEALMFLSCLCVRAFVRAEYVEKCLTHFHQTDVKHAVWERDARFTFRGQRSRSWRNCWKQRFSGRGVL